ncbi:MAG: hypothetical protein ABI298_03690, partial [Acidimicrobiales bacterium]
MHRAMKGVVVEVGTAEQPVMVVPADVNVTLPALLVVAVIAAGAPLSAGALPVRTTVEAVAALAAVTPKVATLARARAPTAMPDINRFIVYCLLFSFDYLTLRLPVRVALNASDSLLPAVVDLIENDPKTFNVPVAPVNLPVPLVTIALPVTETVVGAAASAAQPLLVVANFRWRVLPPPVKTPTPLMGSQLPEGLAPPVPETVASPRL